MQGALEPNAPNATLILINNYTSLIEYVVDPVGQVCQLYGADGFYNWGFGPTFAMQDDGSYEDNGATYYTYSNPTNGFQWVAKVRSTDVLLSLSVLLPSIRSSAHCR